MVKRKRKLFPGIYLVLVVSVLAGAWAGLARLPVPPEVGIQGSPAREGRLSPTRPERITLLEDARLIIRHRDRDCVLEVGDLPPGLQGFSLAGASREDILDRLGSGWEVKSLEPHRLVLEYGGELCSRCLELRYIGLYRGKIAIFSGVPPDGQLLEVTDFEYKDIYREDLEEGIPFRTEEEKKSILESYTT